jgi:chorismate synthase
MERLLFRTAGESHGRGLAATLEGLPFGFAPDPAHVDAALRRRQGGYGRSGRQQIEQDRVEFLTGLKRGKTIGAPLVLWVANRDTKIDTHRTVTRPRPGHADYAGAARFETDDVADVLERASARETAARTAAGAVAEQLLAAAGIRVGAFVTAIGAVRYPEVAFDAATRDASPFYGLDPATDAAAAAAVDDARRRGDSLGGEFVVEATGLFPGLGDHAQWDRRLDSRLGAALFSIPAIRAVAVGDGARAAAIPGSAFHDPILPREGGGVLRPTNHAGGLEGGMTNGEPIRLSAVMKPIPTLLTPLDSVDLKTGKTEKAAYERSDVCAVPSASVVGQAMVALVLCDAVLAALGDVPFSRFAEAVESLRTRRRRPGV